MTNKQEDSVYAFKFAIMQKQIDKLKEKLDLKNKQLDLMAEMLVKVPGDGLMAKYINQNLKEKKKEIKQYFENKAKEVK